MNSVSTQEMISSIENLVRDACQSEANIISGSGAWTHHIVFVVKYAKELALILGADRQIVEIAALLHDYAGIKDVTCYAEHHIHGAREAEIILKKFEYPQEKIELVKRCILSHRGSVHIPRTTPEEICVASADAMAHIDQLASLMYHAFKNKDLSIEDGKAWLRGKMNRTWNKLCPEAQSIIKHKYECALEVLR